MSTQSETFLGDMVDKCYKLKLKPGQTLFIPTGWIHAVYTPVHSIVFGGNFLHSLNIQLQLRVFELEGRLKDPPKYRFPSFEVVHWLAAGKLKKDLADLNSDNTPCPENLLNGIRALVATLRLWTNELTKHEPVDQLDCNGILKDLNREVKTAEKISMKVNPPKPERESNRRRKKKPVDEDFIDLSDPSSLYLYDWDQKMTPGARRPVKSRHTVCAVKSKPPGDPEEEQDDQEEHFEFRQHPRMTVSPLRLSLSSAKDLEKLVKKDPKKENNRKDITKEEVDQPSIKPLPPQEPDERFDLTDRDSVRQLMVSKKADLTSALDDAMADFGDGEPDAAGLVIDEKPKKMVKRPLKIRLSMSSQNSDSGVSCLPLAEEHPGMEAVNSPSTRDAIAGGLQIKLNSLDVFSPGMLSISQTEKLPPKLAVKASLKKRSHAAMFPSREEKINKVHQDEDFIYPTLGNCCSTDMTED